MNRFRPIVIVALLIGAALVTWLLLGGSKPDRKLSGYIEGEDLYLSAPVSGTVGSVSAVEGQRVAGGQQLFTIDPATLSAQGEQAEAGLAAAKTQIASAEAQAQQAAAEVAAAAADADRARRDLARLESVRRDDSAAVAGKDLDAARAAFRNAEARVAAARKTADSRRAQVAAAQAQAAEAAGSRREVDIRVGQLSPAAPAAARIDEVFFQKGEWVAANQPVVSLLPDDRIVIRLFVPERQVALYRPGRALRFSCDSCATGLSATVSYVSPRPEFTPPVIYSIEARDRLVYLVEARPTHPERLTPGLPVDVTPLEADR